MHADFANGHSEKKQFKSNKNRNVERKQKKNIYYGFSDTHWVVCRKENENKNVVVANHSNSLAILKLCTNPRLF